MIAESPTSDREARSCFAARSSIFARRSLNLRRAAASQASGAGQPRRRCDIWRSLDRIELCQDGPQGSRAWREREGVGGDHLPEMIDEGADHPSAS
jgi:hypothetical protein